ncbi:MAG TPA: PH domain-containing protein [Polyangiaceae bacterium]|nr:PH domain-containing protein [Polyangiaceae bacterium]
MSANELVPGQVTPTPGVVGGETEEVLFEGRPALIGSVGQLLLCLITLGLWLIPSWWSSLSRHYRITSRRVVVETGVLSKKMEQVDLYRISDYTVERPIGQRLVGTGNILLKTFDKTTPEVTLGGLKTDVVVLYEKLRAATEIDRKKRGVRMVDYE